VKLPLLLKLFPVYVVIISLFSYWTYTNFVYAKPIEIPPVSLQQEFIKSKPTKILVPSLSLEINIEEGNYNSIDKSWNVSDQNAQFISVSDNPGPENGNTVIYAHNTKNLFGDTHKLKDSDNVYLYNENSNLIEYEYTGFKLVDPSNVSVINSSDSSKLTLITCSGLFNQKRRIMDFKFVQIIK
jgi:LPXTG-site transpeptidase (sortase) family protein